MAYKLHLFVLSVLLMHEISHAFIIRSDPNCRSNDNDTLNIIDREKCSWLYRVQRKLGKYRNFFANLLQENNGEYAVELQDLYNNISMALDETDMKAKHTMLFYSLWLIETTKELEEFLITKGITDV